MQVTSRCNDVVMLQQRRMEEEQLGEEEASQPAAIRGQGFSVFGAKPITCEVGKATAAVACSKDHDARPSTANTTDIRSAIESESDHGGFGGGDGVADVRDDPSSDADWRLNKGVSFSRVHSRDVVMFLLHSGPKRSRGEQTVRKRGAAKRGGRGGKKGRGRNSVVPDYPEVCSGVLLPVSPFSTQDYSPVSFLVCAGTWPRNS
jgi:hypothetical protein